mmetsp:Transcript_13679/g.26453  ORF Transcript_13679/g.26453 Transcript_13679/m.26453 type:complete len:506 (+) Transcript_13679:139-1656(+)
MKFKALSRSEVEHTRDRRDDVLKMQRNADPSLHPFERAREYTRALNAVKLQKMFAKPLVGQLEGHMDGIWCMATSPRSMRAFVTGAADGEVRVWDLTYHRCMWSTPAHAGIVRGISVSHDGDYFYSCGDDKTIKRYKLTSDGAAANDIDELANLGNENDEDDDEYDDDEGYADEDGTAIGKGGKGKRQSRRPRPGVLLTSEEPHSNVVEPVATYTSSHPLQGVDCHWGDNRFASCGEQVDIWDSIRLEPVQTFSWGADSIRSVRFNPAERNLLGSTGSDRSICLYDVRQSTPLRKVVLEMKSNALAWNPMEPLNFTCANEDGNLYTFDMRNLKKALIVHRDHVAAVQDVKYSPTGREFVTAGYDRTVRLFKTQSGRSHQMYHAKRMQRVYAAEFSRDGRFVLSGSGDANIRIWKADASKPLGKALSREQQARDYNTKLIQRYKHVKELNRIHRHQITPKVIKKMSERERVMRDSRRRKTERMLKSDPNAPKPKQERERHIVKELE